MANLGEDILFLFRKKKAHLKPSRTISLSPSTPRPDLPCLLWAQNFTGLSLLREYKSKGKEIESEESKWKKEVYGSPVQPYFFLIVSAVRRKVLSGQLRSPRLLWLVLQAGPLLSNISKTTFKQNCIQFKLKGTGNYRQTVKIWISYKKYRRLQ